ncbi:MAG TPA: hypothetical protein VMW24_24810 [Sedimentisphaerales bacterium]|nr:hypothetical protein [Sedimentisphaerales bacterium]
MTQRSLWWPTDGTGDGSVDGYSMDDVTRDQGIRWNPAYTDAAMGAGIFDPHGVFFEHLNALVSTVVVGPPDDIQIDTGAGIVHGFLYENDAPVLFRPFNPAGVTGWLVVLRVDWNAQTVRLALLQSADGVAGPPNPTQTDGVVWEIRLIRGTVAPGGAITTLTAWRRYVDAIAPIFRVKEYIPCVTAIRAGAEIVRSTMAGWDLLNGFTTDCYGNWSVPIEAVNLGFGQAGVMFWAVLTGPDLSGNVVLTNRAQWGANGVAYNSGTSGGGNETETYPGGQQILECCPHSIMGAVPPVVAGTSRVSLRFQRLGADAADTLPRTVYFHGWIAEYLIQFTRHMA